MQVRRHNDTGMYDDAKRASDSARLFVKLGIIIGSIILGICGVVAVLVIVGHVVFAGVAVAVVGETAEN